MKRKIFFFAAFFFMTLMVREASGQEWLNNIRRSILGGDEETVAEDTTAVDSAEVVREVTEEAASAASVQTEISSVVPETPQPRTQQTIRVSKPVNQIVLGPNEKIIGGFKPELRGMTSSQIAELKTELAEFVLGKNPAEQMIEVVGLTDTLGWQNLPQSQWADADSALGDRRAATVQRLLQDELGWEARTADVKTNTLYRGVLVRLVKYQEPRDEETTVIAPPEPVIIERSQSDTSTSTNLIIEVLGSRIDGLSKKIDDDFGEIKTRLNQDESSINSAQRRLDTVEDRVTTLEGRPVSVPGTSWSFGIGALYYSAKKISVFVPRFHLSFYRGDWAIKGQYGYWPGNTQKSGGSIASIALENRSFFVHPATGFLFSQETYEADLWKKMSTNWFMGVSFERDIGVNANFFIGATYGRVWGYQYEHWNGFGVMTYLSIAIFGRGGLR